MSPRARMLVFFGATLFLCSWHLDGGHNDNTMSRALAVAALVGHGTLEITEHHELTGDKALINGHYYSDKAPLPVFIVAPFWWLGRVIGAVKPGELGYFNDGLLRLGGFLCGFLPLALIITLLWTRLRQVNARSPVVLALLPLFGSFLFVYSGSFYGHLLGALFTLLALIAHEQDRHRLSGLMAGLAVLCEYTLAIFPLCWCVLLLLRDRKAVLQFALGGIPPIVLLLLYNWNMSGNPFKLGYSHEANYAFMNDRFGFRLPTWEAIWGLSFSAYRGLFFYMPVLVVGTIAWITIDRWSMRRLAGPVVIPVVVSFLMIASYAMWWGGWAYGPRHLTTATVLLAWRGIPLIPRKPQLWWPAIAFSGFGFLCAFLAKSTLWYSLPTGVKDPLVEEVLIRAADGEWTEWQWPVQLGLAPGTSTLLFLLIFATAMIILHRLDRSSTTA